MTTDPFLVETVLDEPLAAILARPPAKGFRLYWLGQAGFVTDIDGMRLILDPYLSDTLAEKYKGTPRPHIRMMPAPVRPEEIDHVDAVLCTHAHTDHMDPGTLKPLFAANPAARLVAPRAMLQQALERSGLDESEITGVDAGERIDINGISVIATRAAHETLERDAGGNHRFLGYVLAAPCIRLWHSGDCVPFDGLVAEVGILKPDIALLPCNGRRPELGANGVPGNFSLAEALTTALDVGAGAVVMHHYGLFDFNTEKPEAIDALAADTDWPLVVRARGHVCYGRGAVGV